MIAQYVLIPNPKSTAIFGFKLHSQTVKTKWNNKNDSTYILSLLDQFDQIAFTYLPGINQENIPNSNLKLIIDVDN